MTSEDPRSLIVPTYVWEWLVPRVLVDYYGIRPEVSQ